jgi:hypothetical protein
MVGAPRFLPSFPSATALHRGRSTPHSCQTTDFLQRSVSIDKLGPQLLFLPRHLR